MTKKIYFSKISEELRNTLTKQSKDLEKLSNSLSIRPEFSEGLRGTMKISEGLHNTLAKRSQDLDKLYNSLLIRPEFLEGFHDTLAKQSRDLDKLYNSLSVRLEFSEGLHNAMTYRSKDLERLRNAIAHQSQYSGNTLFPLEGKVSREVEGAKKADSDNTVLPDIEKQSQNSDNSLTPLQGKVLEKFVLLYLEHGHPVSSEDVVREFLCIQEKDDVLHSINKIKLEEYIEEVPNTLYGGVGYVPTEKGSRWCDKNRHN